MGCAICVVDDNEEMEFFLVGTGGWSFSYTTYVSPRRIFWTTGLSGHAIRFVALAYLLSLSFFGACGDVSTAFPHQSSSIT